MMATQYSGVREVMKKYEVVIGIEVHCQLATRSKIFSSSANAFGAEPNENIDPTCVGLPGALPTVNQACVDLCIRMGLATDCAIAPVSVFARKNYFYPDLPKGYQITQFDKPLCHDGRVMLSNGKQVRIDRIQLEEDAGKSIHAGGSSFLDFNRSGVGLIEIVSAPDLATPEEASEYVRRLHEFAVHLGISDGDMERGNFRADANVSLRPIGARALGQRTEIKNVNSFRFMERAIAHEIERQWEILEGGGRVEMETRGFDSDAGVTYAQRSKESAHDYRYFPDPDLPPLYVSEERVARVRSEMPELPDARARRFAASFGLSEADARSLSQSPLLSREFEELFRALNGKVEAKTISSYLLSDVLRALKDGDERASSESEPSDEAGNPARLVPRAFSIELLELVGEGVLSGRMAKEVFDEMQRTRRPPRAIVEEKGLVQVSDDGAILQVVTQVLDANAKTVADYHGGKEKLFAFFVGQSMKLSGGKLNPARLNEILKSELEKRRP